MRFSINLINLQNCQLRWVFCKHYFKEYQLQWGRQTWWCNIEDKNCITIIFDTGFGSCMLTLNDSYWMHYTIGLLCHIQIYVTLINNRSKNFGNWVYAKPLSSMHFNTNTTKTIVCAWFSNAFGNTLLHSLKAHYPIKLDKCPMV